MRVWIRYRNVSLYLLLPHGRAFSPLYIVAAHTALSLLPTQVAKHSYFTQVVLVVCAQEERGGAPFIQSKTSGQGRKCARHINVAGLCIARPCSNLQTY